jgi:RNA polymerase-binding transcription factor DksA
LILIRCYTDPDNFRVCETDFTRLELSCHRIVTEVLEDARMDIEPLLSSLVSTTQPIGTLGAAGENLSYDDGPAPAELSDAEASGKTHKEQRLDAFTVSQRNKLLELRHAIQWAALGVKSDLRSGDMTSETSGYGTHPADAGSEANDRDLALSLLSQEQNALYEIDQALERIALGVYGICEMSGQAIPRARLEAIPFARFTVECQSRMEKQRRAFQARPSVASVFGLNNEEDAQNDDDLLS